MTREEREEATDAWYFNLESMAKRIEENERRHLTIRKRQYVVVGFVVLAFFLLAYRSEVNANRISGSSDRIAVNQKASCQSGREILIRFNTFLDDQTEVERINPHINEKIRALRIEAFRNARIDPLPVCINQEAR